MAVTRRSGKSCVYSFTVNEPLDMLMQKLAQRIEGTDDPSPDLQRKAMEIGAKKLHADLDQEARLGEAEQSIEAMQKQLNQVEAATTEILELLRKR